MKEPRRIVEELLAEGTAREVAGTLAVALAYAGCLASQAEGSRVQDLLLPMVRQLGTLAVLEQNRLDERQEVN